MTQTMHAVVLDAPGPVENLHVRDVPLPQPSPGHVRIKVEAFGINRSELHTRLGLAGDAVTFPRILVSRRPARSTKTRPAPLPPASRS